MNRVATSISYRLRARAFVFCLCAVLFAAFPSSAREAGPLNINDCSPDLIRLYISLAYYSKMAYDIPESGQMVTPSGCVATVVQDYGNNLIIAFRGSVMPPMKDRNDPHPALADLLRLRSFQDWIETNLPQSSGELPRQYVEAANLAIDQIMRHPNVNRIYITGHSKGGGEAEFAITAASLSSAIPDHVKAKMMAVTFNAAVVRAKNWRRLLESCDEPQLERYFMGIVPRIDALSLYDDPVSRVDSVDRRKPPYVNWVVIDPTEDLWAHQQHGIALMITELENRLKGIFPQTRRKGGR